MGWDAIRDQSDARLVDRWVEGLSAASYGTVLVLAALLLIDAEEVSSGLGWELVTGVGVATWVAHFFAEVVGDQVRHESSVDRAAIGRAMADGLPILLATLVPGLVLLLGRLGVLDERVALWVAVAGAVLQLAGVGAVVGIVGSSDRRVAWTYATATAAVGLGVVVLKVVLGH
jgi:hypothetical protein